MGSVFLGRDPAGHHVAVKVIRPEYAGDEQFRARFRGEVSRVLQVPSFCTAAVLDADPDSDTPYLVVEYVDGPSLQEVVEERGPMSAGDLHSVAVGVAAALTAIHGAGVIHRDLKPLNVLLSLGLPKVIDFGIARALETTSRHTRTGQYVGTVDYMAPERLDPTLGPDSAAADIFAWGGVIAFAGTGRIPFYGDTPMATAAQILTKPPGLAGLPDSLVDIVARALAKEPRDRPTANDLMQQLLAVSGPKTVPRQSAGRFNARDLLEQVVAERPERASPPPPPPPPSSPASPSTPSTPSTPSSPSSPSSPSEPRRRRPSTARRLAYAVSALLVASVTAATVAYARTTDEPPATGLETKLAPITAASAQEPTFADALRAPGPLREASGEYGSCQFEDDQLHARVDRRATYQCPGPDDKFAGDQSITVDLELVTGGACAMVWFRYHGDRGYQMTACANQIELEELDGAILTSIGRAPSTALKPGTRHKLAIAVASGHAAITIDGATALQAAVSAPGLASGRIQLGVTNISATNAAEVAFSDLEVRAS